MAIGFRAGSRADINANLSTTTITKPAGTASDDVLVTFLSTGRVGTPNVLTTAPSGWTPIATGLTVNDGTDWVTLYGWVALGNVVNLGFSNDRTNETQGWVCLAFTGVDNVTPIDAAGTPNSVNGVGTITAGAVTVVTDQAWEVIGVASWHGGTWTATGFTAFQNVVTPPASSEDCACLYNTTPKGTGSTGTVVCTSTGATGGQILLAMPFALRPVADASVGVRALYDRFPKTIMRPIV